MPATTPAVDRAFTDLARIVMRAVGPALADAVDAALTAVDGASPALVRPNAAPLLLRIELSRDFVDIICMRGTDELIPLARVDIATL